MQNFTGFKTTGKNVYKQNTATIVTIIEWNEQRLKLKMRIKELVSCLVTCRTRGRQRSLCNAWPLRWGR